MTIRLQLRIDSDSTSIWAESSFHLSTDALRNRKPELCPGLSVCICRQVCGFTVRFVCVLQKGCSCCHSASVASVVAQCVHAVVARLAVDSLVVVFPVWRTLASKSRRGALGSLQRNWGLRYAVDLAGAFWQVFPELYLGGSGGGSPRTGLRCFC
ncbi:hypothetical protein Taro_016906 [Colocasia esculenta]|uniref:Uncharacterized protein n=1 Tax=Colocasia esculenta TaxID=4460 RepID=A0A843UEY7_COLES|nr:hypothetical protein [Colocasia esculenta]